MKIAHIVLPHMLVTSFSNAYELMYASRMKALSDRLPIAKKIQLHRVSTAITPIEMNSGLIVMPDCNLDNAQYDMVFIPALWRSPAPLLRKNADLIQWLRYQWEHGAIINATGTGVCFVAESGLLDGKAATTHWHYFDTFARAYPNVNLKRQHFITSAGKLFCAASINAQTDLVLHHVQRFIGKDVSDHLSRHFSHEVRQPYDRLSFDQEKENAHPDEAILQSQLWLQNNINKNPFHLSDLSELLGMSERNFSRRFKFATGLTPLQYLQSQRHLEAQDLLKNSNLSIGEIAYRVGYQDLSYFSKRFKKFNGTTPRQWRKSLRAKLFNPTQDSTVE